MRKTGVVTIKTEDRICYRHPDLVDEWEFGVLVDTIRADGYVYKDKNNWRWLAPYHITSIVCDWN